MIQIVAGNALLTVIGVLFGTSLVAALFWLKVRQIVSLQPQQNKEKD